MVLKVLVLRKGRMLPISAISNSTNLDNNTVKNALIELINLGYIRSSTNFIDINNSVFCCTHSGINAFNKRF